MVKPINWGGMLEPYLQPLKERGIPGQEFNPEGGLSAYFSPYAIADVLAPVGTYEDGRMGLAMPKALTDLPQFSDFVTSIPRGAYNMVSGIFEKGRAAAESPIPPINDDAAWADKSAAMFDAASLAPIAGLGMTAAGVGTPRGAIGSAGGKMTGKSMRAFGSMEDKASYMVDRLGKEGAIKELEASISKPAVMPWDEGVKQTDMAMLDHIKNSGLYSNPEEAALPALMANALERPDLPMDLASRMARAKEMGFDVDNPVYHGTNAQFDEFKPSDRGALGPGVYFSKVPGVAENYGTPGEYMVRGTILNTGPFRDIPNGLTDAIKSQLTPDEAARWDRMWPTPRDMGGYTIGNADAETLREVLTRSVEPARVPEIMRAAGYDGMQGIADGHELTIFDPRNIRSVNAAFDPSKADSANLLAANAVTGSLPSLTAQTQDDTDPQTLTTATLLRLLRGQQ